MFRLDLFVMKPAEKPLFDQPEFEKRVEEYVGAMMEHAALQKRKVDGVYLSGVATGVSMVLTALKGGDWESYLAFLPSHIVAEGEQDMPMYAKDPESES